MSESKNWQREFAEKWVKHWPPPARPTPGVVRFLRQKVQNFSKDNPKVMILGSTTEFRDMLYELGIKPTVVDFSEENYQILSGALKYKGDYNEKEEYIEEDWRTMDLGRQFDIILADAVFNIVPPEDNEKMLKNVGKHLAPGGIFIDRIHLIPDGYKDTYDFWEEVKKRREDIEIHSLYTVFGTPSYFAAVNNENFMEPIPLKEVAKVGDKLKDMGLISQQAWEEFRKLGKHETEFVFFLPPKKFVDERVQKYFDVEEVFIDLDWPFYPEFYCEYVMKKK